MKQACNVGLAMLVGLAAIMTVRAEEVEPDNTWTQRVVESYQELRAQQQLTRDAIEKSRQENAAAVELARRNAASVEERLRGVEASLEQARQSSLRTMGVIVGAGFVGLVILALILWRAMSRRVERLTVVGGGAPVPVLGNGAQSLAALNPAEQSSVRFLGAMERLERRIAEMEAEAGWHAAAAERPVLEVVPLPSRDEKAEASALWIGKGRALFNLGRYEEALGCFDEAINADPQQAEAHVKKGKTLEKLDRFEEALAEYDRALELDASLTIAYLYKGGLLNHLERFAEALACYEEALRAQESGRVAQINA